MTAKKQYFGTDGIRARVGEFPMTPDFVLKLGFAAGLVFKESHKTPKILIGKDTRLSGYLMESALEAGFSAAGANVHLVGPLPTPGVAYLTKTFRMDAGVVISASHNSFLDNGIKFFSSDGEKLPDDLELKIEANLALPFSLDAAQIGRALRIDDARGRYIEFCKSTLRANLHLKGLKIVVDCANGAAYQTAPLVFEELGASVIAIANEPNGLNINDHCGSTHIDFLQNAVLREKADLGIALDGDADRLHLVDSNGRIYDGDMILYAIAKNRLKHGTISKTSGVAGTLMTNIALEKKLHSWHIPFARTNVGDRYVFERLRQNGWTLGGENSGHILLLDKHSTGDATIAALEVLSALMEENTDLPHFIGDFALYPQVLKNVQISAEQKEHWQKNAKLRDGVREVEQRLKNGRILLRASGTEPLLRIMVEGENLADVKAAAQHLAEIAQQ